MRSRTRGRGRRADRGGRSVHRGADGRAAAGAAGLTSPARGTEGDPMPRRSDSRARAVPRAVPRAVLRPSRAAIVAALVMAGLLHPVAPLAHAAAPAAVPGATVSTVGGAVRFAIALRELAEELRPFSYRPPVDARVVRLFDPPADTYGPGHRGVDLDAAPGVPVRAAERGRVGHAGQVAGVVWVAIDHEDGIRTTYGPLTALAVRAGDAVERGAMLGHLADADHGQPDVDRGLHFGARRDGVYLDPMRLPGIGSPRPTLVGTGGWWGADHAVDAYGPWSGGRLSGVLTSPSPPATTPGYAVPPNANHLVLVAGLASTDAIELINPTHLGIDPAGSTRFSYVGPDRGYGVEDTWEGVQQAARRLEVQLREQAARQPGRAVDLLGHSLGGVVIAWYLLHLHDPFDIGLPAIGHVVTVASPLEGSDLARAGVALVDAPGVGGLLRSAWVAAASLLGLAGETARSLEPDAESLRDLATGSRLLEELGGAWDAARLLEGSGPLATGTRVLNIVASLDGLVGADRAALDDAERRVLPGTHEGVLATEAVREVVWRFLAGREVVASPGHLTTHTSAWYGTALTVVSALAGDVAAANELPFPPFPWSAP